MRTLLRASGVFLLATSFYVPLHAQNAAYQVPPVSGAGFAELQLAIDSAADGDVLLLTGTAYAGNPTPLCNFLGMPGVNGYSIMGKGITLLGAAPGGARPVISDKLTIENIPAGATVVVRGIDFVSTDPRHPIPFRIAGNGGRVFVEDCTFTSLAHTSNCSPSNLASVVVENGGGDTTFTRCTFEGAEAGPTVPALPALAVTTTDNVALYDCALVGGDGAPNGRSGAVGLVVWAARVFASGTMISGGDGDTGLAGGDAIRLLDGSTIEGVVELMDCELIGGTAPGGTTGGELSADSESELTDVFGRAHSSEIAPAWIEDTTANGATSSYAVTTELTGAFEGQGFGLLVRGAPLHVYHHDVLYPIGPPPEPLVVGVGVATGPNFPFAPFLVLETGLVTDNGATPPAFTATVTSTFSSGLTGPDPNTSNFFAARTLFFQPVFYDNEYTQRSFEFYNVGSPTAVTILHPDVVP